MQHFAWTDSCVVLGWLQGNPRRFKTFVGNRITEILDAIPIECWRHVHETVNPADCASTGMFPVLLTQHDLWWCGPPWLREPIEQWEASIIDFPEHPIPSEERQLPQIALATNTVDFPLLQRVSSYERLVRITAWMLRFVRNCQRKDERLVCPKLTMHELGLAEKLWWRIV